MVIQMESQYCPLALSSQPAANLASVLVEPNSCLALLAIAAWVCSTITGYSFLQEVQP
jgi:hypothetical protein